MTFAWPTSGSDFNFLDCQCTYIINVLCLENSRLQSQLESMKTEMSSKDEVLASLEEKLMALEEGRVRMQQEVSAMKDKLNVSEVPDISA